MKIKSWDSILKSVINLVLIGLLLLSAGAWRGRVFGISLKDKVSKEYIVGLEPEDCKSFFPNVDAMKRVNNFQFNIFNHSDVLIGYAFTYKGEHGYGGRVPVITFTDVNDTICGILLGENYESENYLADAVKKGILKKWNGLQRNQIKSLPVDAVAGATITSHAIISGVQNSAATIQVKPKINFWKVENIVSLLLLVVLVIACFLPQKMMKYRTVLQLLTVLVFGFWLGRLISFVQIINWLSGGVNWQLQLIMIILVASASVIPIVFGKAFYCSWVCPYGAVQELCGKACSKKIRISPRGTKILKPLRERIFLVLLVSLWTGYSYDLTLIEPFTIFSITKVSLWVIGFASFFLVLAMFIPKAWCRFFCPVGFMLEWIRK
ncbi:4Fe-4S binding protein [Saccharicrinis sp. 156]|uniref:4Fe-4S binding protein n=1 Tax=Saccharicrinis sp. 156 TaxID=3417574 RepID=UPI003D33E207